MELRAVRILYPAACVVLALAIGPSFLPASFLPAQAKSGKDVFEARCAGCHALDRDKEGPRLAGVYGRAAASVPSFQYSDALAKSKITWNEETLDKWLTDPEELVPDNDMAFRVTNSEERRNIIEFLKQQSTR
jgi:cytochrome c